MPGPKSPSSKAVELPTDELETRENMVLRTVYLPVELDQTLKEDSSKRGVSKGDLIRRALWSFYHVTPG